jgi:hypothetical protein
MPFSIVFQGLLTEEYVDKINSLKDSNLNIHIVTWKNINNSHSKLSSNFKLHLLDDVGSISAYSLCGINKEWNLDRLLYCLNYVHDHVTTDIIIKCRTNVLADFNLIYSLFVNSNKLWGSVGINTTCPRRLSSDPYLWVISDWIFIYNKRHVNFNNWQEIKQFLFKQQKITRIGNYFWHIKLGAEQVLSMIMTNNEEQVYLRYIKGHLNEYTQDDWSLHYSIQNKTLNIIPEKVNFRNFSKYRGGFSIKWNLYSTEDFRDDGILTFRLHWLFVRIVILIKNKFL